MSNMYDNQRRIDIEFTILSENTSDVGIRIQSEDGGPLSAQEILDAISDVLLTEWENISTIPLSDKDFDS